MISQDAPTVTDELIAELQLDVQVSTEMRMPAVMVDPGHLAALIAERADLKLQLAAASVDAERWRYARADTSTGKSDICVVKKIWGDGCKYTQEIILTEAAIDAAIDAARDIAAMDIGSGD